MNIPDILQEFSRDDLETIARVALEGLQRLADANNILAQTHMARIDKLVANADRLPCIPLSGNCASPMRE